MAWVFTNNSRFYLHESESLLDGLLRTGHDISYQCKEGYCGACRVQRVKGSHAIDYPFEPLALISEDELLACCCIIRGFVRLNL